MTPVGLGVQGPLNPTDLLLCLGAIPGEQGGRKESLIFPLFCSQESNDLGFLCCLQCPWGTTERGLGTGVQVLAEGEWARPPVGDVGSPLCGQPFSTLLESSARLNLNLNSRQDVTVWKVRQKLENVR